MKGQERKGIKWICAVLAIGLVVVGVLVGTLLKKDKDVELVITAENITVQAGQSKQVEYKSSISKAVIKFRVIDKEVAEINEDTVIGKVAGQTELVITGRYSGMVYEKRVVVTVTKKEDNASKPGDEKEPSGESGDKKPDETETSTKEIGVEVYFNDNCEIFGKTIEMRTGEMALIGINAKSDYGNFTVESNSEKLTVQMAEDIQRGVILEPIEAGEYKLTLKFETGVATFTVKVF